MIPIVAGLLSTLAQNGLGLLVGAIQSKGKEIVEQKLGIQIPNNPSSADIEKLRIAEMQHEEVLLTLQIQKAELDLKEKRLYVEDTQNARDMNARIQESYNASWLSKVAAYYLDFLVVGATILLVALLLFKAIPEVNKELTYMALGALLAHCGTIMNFHRGTSASSKGKDETILAAVKKGEMK